MRLWVKCYSRGTSLLPAPALWLLQDHPTVPCCAVCQMVCCAVGLKLPAEPDGSQEHDANAAADTPSLPPGISRQSCHPGCHAGAPSPASVLDPEVTTQMPLVTRPGAAARRNLLNIAAAGTNCCCKLLQMRHRSAGSFWCQTLRTSQGLH